MGKHSDSYMDSSAGEKAVQRWLFHLLRDWVKGTTDKKIMERRLKKLLQELRTDSNKKYAMKRMVELMKVVDKGMVALYYMIEKER